MPQAHAIAFVHLPRSAPPQPDTAVLHRLLDDGLRLRPEYADGLSSHLPMALQALDALGAGGERLQAFHARHAARFAPRTPHRTDRPLTDGDWLQARGRLDAFEPLASYFAKAIGREGSEATLRRALPALLPGVAAAAFHGLLRTAHGWAAGHAGEVAMGLAYWAARWQPLGPLERPATGPDLDVDEWLDAVAALQTGSAPASRLIAERMRAAASLAGFASTASRLRSTPSTLSGLAASSADLYARTGDFTVLHLVTASNAMRRLLPLMGDADPAMAWFAQAAAAARLASGTGTPARRTSGPRPWTILVARAIASEDEHVIKLVEAARAWGDVSGAPSFQRAADRAIGTDSSDGADDSTDGDDDAADEGDA